MVIWFSLNYANILCSWKKKNQQCFNKKLKWICVAYGASEIVIQTILRQILKSNTYERII